MKSSGFRQNCSNGPVRGATVFFLMRLPNVARQDRERLGQNVLRQERDLLSQLPFGQEQLEPRDPSAAPRTVAPLV